jgi:hypothetical protein
MSTAILSYVRSIGAALVVLAIASASPRDKAAAQDAFGVGDSDDVAGYELSGAPVAVYGPPSVPSLCSSKPQRAQKYQQGLTKGIQKADELFASSEIGKNPDKLQKKINRVLERLRENVREAWRSEAKDNRRCRVQGVADGFLTRIVELLGQCILDGAQWGKFTAELYCALSLELGGLGEGGVFVRAPAGLCGSLFQTTCDGVYSYVASEGKTQLPATVSKFCSDRGISVSPYAGCFPYTTGNFAEIFSSSRNADCAYSQ